MMKLKVCRRLRATVGIFIIGAALLTGVPADARPLSGSRSTLQVGTASLTDCTTEMISEVAAGVGWTCLPQVQDPVSAQQALEGEVLTLNLAAKDGYCEANPCIENDETGGYFTAYVYYGVGPRPIGYVFEKGVFKFNGQQIRLSQHYINGNDESPAIKSSGAEILTRAGDGGFVGSVRWDNTFYSQSNQGIPHTFGPKTIFNSDASGTGRLYQIGFGNSWTALGEPNPSEADGKFRNGISMPPFVCDTDDTRVCFY